MPFFYAYVDRALEQHNTDKFTSCHSFNWSFLGRFVCETSPDNKITNTQKHLRTNTTKQFDSVHTHILRNSVHQTTHSRITRITNTMKSFCCSLFVRQRTQIHSHTATQTNKRDFDETCCFVWHIVRSELNSFAVKLSLIAWRSRQHKVIFNSTAFVCTHQLPLIILLSFFPLFQTKSVC